MNESTSNSLYEKRVKVQNRWVTGHFQNIRVITIWLTLTWFFVAPWLTWEGHQAILFDLPKRQFFIFAFTFWPQDFFLLSWALIIVALGLIALTNLAGRIWCGYVCPQTVWTKFFMWIEYLAEGDRNKRLARDKNPWKMNTLFRRMAKHFFWLLLAAATAMTFVGYFSPIGDLYHQAFTFNLHQWPLFFIVLFTAGTYMNAGWMREQVCLHMCPYARFQSVMVDKNTLVIAYDEQRGEPRGSRKMTADPKTMHLGDCVDCQMCVQVCPTGIDIRKGLQMGCIACAACIDACDSVMDKMLYPRGLVRYASENTLQGKTQQILRPRLMANVAVLLVMSSVFLWTMLTRVPMALDIVRSGKQIYRETPDAKIQNTYLLKVMNMSQKNQRYQINLAQNTLPVEYIGPKHVAVKSGEILTVPVTLQVPKNVITQPSYELVFNLTDDTQHQKTASTRFLAPLTHRSH